MAVKIAPPIRQQFEDANGNPAVGYKLFTYAAGSSTNQTTFTDSTGLTANTNPIILDASGRTPFGLYLTAGLNYKFVYAPPTDTDPPTSPIFTEDNVAGVNDTATTTSQWIASAATPTYISGTQFSLVGDKTADFHVGRRLKFTVTAGTVYGLISVVAYTTLTTVTVVMDSTALDSGLSAVELSILLASGHAVPKLSSANLTALGIQPQDAELTTLAGITATQATDLASLSTFVGTLLNEASQSVFLATLGAPLGSLSTLASNYTIVAGDRGRLFDYTGTFTLSITAAATLGTSFVFAVRNSGTGVVTLDPNGAELVDGLPALAFGPGEACFVLCNGTEFKTVGLVANASITAPKLSGAQTGAAPIYGARAWVNFNGTGTVAIRASGNVSSITDNGVGNYTVNFTTAMADANYATITASRGMDAAGVAVDANSTIASPGVVALGSVGVFIKNSANTLIESSEISVAIFR